MGVGKLAKMRLGGRRRVPRRKVFFIVSVIFVVLTIQSLWFLEKKIQPILRIYANTKVTQIATAIIEEAVKVNIAENPDFAHILIKELDLSGKLQSITLDAQAANRVQVDTTDFVRKSLDDLSTEKITVPLGVALGSSLLASLPPNVPITFVPVGATNVEIVPELREQGINMVLFTVNLKVTTKVKIVIPFSTDEALVDHNVVIGQQLIIGDVPVYYFNGNQMYPLPIGPALPNEGSN